MINESICVTCGSVITTKICPNCGFKLLKYIGNSDKQDNAINDIVSLIDGKIDALKKLKDFLVFTEQNKEFWDWYKKSNKQQVDILLDKVKNILNNF